MCLAVPGKILSIEKAESLERSGVVDFEGVRRGVNLAFVPEAGVGSWVLVHAGIAIGTIDEEEAQLTLEALRSVDALGGGEAGQRPTGETEQ